VGHKIGLIVIISWLVDR